MHRQSDEEARYQGMSDRHQRRMNWQGVVLNTRLQQLRAREERRKRIWFNQHNANALITRIIARERIAQGIDRWEDDGGPCR